MNLFKEQAWTKVTKLSVWTTNKNKNEKNEILFKKEPVIEKYIYLSNIKTFEKIHLTPKIRLKILKGKQTIKPRLAHPQISMNENYLTIAFKDSVQKDKDFFMGYESLSQKDEKTSVTRWI